MYVRIQYYRKVFFTSCLCFCPPFWGSSLPSPLAFHEGGVAGVVERLARKSGAFPLWNAKSEDNADKGIKRGREKQNDLSSFSSPHSAHPHIIPFLAMPNPPHC